MLTCAKSAPTARKTCTDWALNPHCGKSGVPFMNSTTGCATASLILSSTLIEFSAPCLTELQPGPAGNGRSTALFQAFVNTCALPGTHSRPARNLLERPQAALAQTIVANATNVYARTLRITHGHAAICAQAAVNRRSFSPQSSS